MTDQLWPWVLSAVGILGFILAGRKIWWSWYVNLACQGLWLAFSLITKQYGFLAATAVYTVVFGQNAVNWTREHRQREAAYLAARRVFPKKEDPEPEDGPSLNAPVHYETLGPELFTNGEVISYKGENYYRACNAWVYDHPDESGGGASYCVKRVGHPGVYHEAYDGRRVPDDSTS